jgi:molecular chaperone HscB
VVCGACGALFREPPGLDHFTLFGLERRYALDEAALERSYLDLSRLLHPDRQVAAKSPEPLRARQSRALALSASMNAAYAVLRSPAKRAEYLMKLFGGPAAEKDKRTPEGFLVEMMERREALEEAKAGGARDALAGWLPELEAREKDAFSRIAALFAATPDHAGLAELRLELNAVKYVSNLIEELRVALRT